MGEVVSTGWIELAAQSMQGEDSEGGGHRLRTPGRGPLGAKGPGRNKELGAAKLMPLAWGVSSCWQGYSHLKV